jgi:hypothetical protein
MDEQSQAPENQNQTPNPASEPAPTPPPTETPPTDAAPPAAEPTPSPATESAPVAALPNVPDQWPGAFGIYKFSKAAMKINLGSIALIWLLSVLIGGFLDWKLKDFSSLSSLIIGGLTAPALSLAYLAGVRKQKLSFGQTIDKAVPFWLKAILLNILVTLATILSLLLLIIPFFFVAPRLALVNFFLVDKDLGPVEAFKASWNATKGNVSKVYAIFGANIAMGLLVITIIGIPFAIYFLIMYAAANAVLYEMIQKSQPAQVAQPAPAPEAASTPPVAPAV